MDKKQAKVDLPSDKGTISTRVEQKQVEDRQAIGANVVYETIRREGEEDCIGPRQHWRGRRSQQDFRWAFRLPPKGC
jgi:hypothetical protein